MNTMMTMLYLTLLQVRDTTVREDGDTDDEISAVVWILIILGALIGAYFIWRSTQKKKDEIPPPTIPPPSTHTTNPPKR